MIFRPPLEPIILLPYYPPGANDPDDPKSGEAVADGVVSYDEEEEEWEVEDDQSKEEEGEAG